jgi:2',3'-cyclic-nucleotide 2'-phosphodiesterase / 3'-nucleotidase
MNKFLINHKAISLSCCMALFLTTFLPVSYALPLSDINTRPDTLHLMVMCTNDIHGWIMPWDYYTDKREESLSHVKAATLIDSIRSVHHNTILLDAGDWLQGNPYAEYFARVDTLNRRFPGMKVFDYLVYDALVIGNHEFNFGVEYLNQQLDSTVTTALGANILHHGTSIPAYPPYIIKRFDDLSVAIIGLTSPGSAVWDKAHVEGVLDFGDGVLYAHQYVREVKEQGVDIVIVLAHTGFEGASSYYAPGVGEENFGRLIAESVPDIDLVVLGHHMQLIDTLLTGPNGKDVGVILAGNRCSHLGCTEIKLLRKNDIWEIVSQNLSLLPVGHADPLPELYDLLQDSHHEVREWTNQPIAHTNNHWHTHTSRKQDSPVIDLINHVQMEATGAQISAASVFKTNVSFGPGPISLGHITQLYHYENTLYLLEVNGKILRDYLEYTSEYYLPMTCGDSLQINPDRQWEGYNFDILSGVCYELDLTRPFGSRVSKLEFNGEPVSDEDLLTMAVNSYRAQRGGGFSMLADARVIDIIHTPVRDLIIDFLRQRIKIDHKDVYNENWHLVGP